jgi:hypothetical protein
MPTLVVDRPGCPILGNLERADELVQWSEKSDPRRRWVKEFPFGLQLSFVSNKLEPKMYIHWNQQKLWSFLEQLGREERFVIIRYGVCVEHHNGRTNVKLLGAGRTGETLWDTLTNAFSRDHSFVDPQDNINWLLGMVKFSTEGPQLYRKIECQQELEEATALAVIHKKRPAPKKPPASAGKVLPAKGGLSPAARSYLLKDALMNIVLKQRSKA